MANTILENQGSGRCILGLPLVEAYAEELDGNNATVRNFCADEALGMGLDPCSETPEVLALAEGLTAPSQMVCG